MQIDLFVLFQNKKIDCKFYIQMVICIYEGCSTRAYYKYPGSKVALYCTKHKCEGMVGYNCRTCAYYNCKKRPMFNYKDEQIRLYCGEHKSEDMVIIGASECVFPGCTKISPRYNYRDAHKGAYCKEHKKPEMVYMHKFKSGRKKDEKIQRLMDKYYSITSQMVEMKIPLPSIGDSIPIDYTEQTIQNIDRF